MPEVLAVVAARGGSKGLAGKNLLQVFGMPLVSWAVRAGVEAGTVTRTIVTTDDSAIAEAALAAGAEVPFLRPAHLAADDTADLPVFQHVLDHLATEGYHPDVVVQLRPTSPARPPGLVDRGVRMLLDAPSADSVRAVCPAPCTPYKMWRMSDGRLRPLLGDETQELYNRPRQALPPVHWQIGTLDVIRAATIRAGSMSGGHILAIELPTDLAVDIDGPGDLARLEHAMRAAGLP